MNLRRTLIAASITAIPLLTGGAASAGNQVMSAPIKASAQDTNTVINQLMARRSTQGLDTDHGYMVASQHPGVIGTKIVRLRHTYKNVPVFGSESVVVTNQTGAIVSESITDRRSGLGRGNGIVAPLAPSFDVTARVTAANAINSVVQSVAPRGTHNAQPTAELIIYPVMKSVRVPSAVGKSERQLNALDLTEVVSRYQLAYLVHTRMMDGGKAVYHDTVIDALDGHIIKQWKALTTAIGTGHSEYNGDVPINTTFDGTNYKMIDASRGTGGTYGAMAITNANHGTSAGSVYSNSTNIWGDGQNYNGGSTTNANGQTAAVNALWGLMNTYDMLKNTLGWQSLDGQNTATYIAAHVNTAYDNAYYDDTCKCMYIGDGSTFTSLGSVDVIGHEMSHGVTASTSNLTYSDESGGLNESNSDIGGEMVEAYAKAGGTGTTISNLNDWQMGEDIGPNHTPLRWMYKPSKDGQSPDAWYSGIGSLDVHYSSGPNNRMFYFLSQGSNSSPSSDYYSQYLTASPAAMTGIGNDKAYRIWFKASTTKFTSSTNYADARAKVLQAAQELYGTNSAEATAVIRAYAAINVGTDVNEGNPPPTVNCNATPIDATAVSCSAAGLSGYTGTAYTLQYSTYTGGGSCTKVTAPGFDTSGCSAPGNTSLTNGVPVTGLSLATGAQKTYTFTVPSGATAATFATSGGTGDVDLYIQLGSAPTTSSYLQASNGSTTSENISLTNPTAGTYYVLLDGYSAPSGFQVVASYTAGGGTGGGSVLTSGVPVSGISGGLNSKTYYTITVPAGRSSLTVKTSGGTGDEDLYLQIGKNPTTSSYLKRSWVTGNTESVTVTSPAAGTYYIMLNGYAAYTGVSLVATY